MTIAIPNDLIAQVIGFARKGISSLVSPFTEAVSYLVPSLGLNQYSQLPTELDPSTQGEVHNRIQEIVKDLSKKTDIQTFANPIPTSSSLGGRFSIHGPIIILPNHSVTKENIYSNQTKFLIAKEIISIQKRDSLLSLISKIINIAIFVFLGFISSTIIPLTGVIAIMLGTSLIHSIFQRIHARGTDIKAVELLEKTYDDKKAKQAAIDVITAEINFNKTLRENGSWWTKLSITEEGNYRFTLKEPRLTSRLKVLQTWNANVSSSLASSTNS